MMIIDLCVPTVFTPDGAVQGCDETVPPHGESGQNFTKLFCNSLQLIAEDDEATEEETNVLEDTIDAESEVGDEA